MCRSTNRWLAPKVTNLGISDVNEGRKREKIKERSNTVRSTGKTSLNRTPPLSSCCVSPTTPPPPLRSVSNKGRLFRFPSHSIVGRAVSHTTVVAFCFYSVLFCVLCLHFHLLPFFSSRNSFFFFY